MKKISVKIKDIKQLLDANIKPHIDTPTGQVQITDFYQKFGTGYIFTFSDGTELKCAINHKIFNGIDFIDACNINVGDVFSSKVVLDKVEVPYQTWCDFSVDAEHESYNHKGLVHHNSGKSLILYSLIRWILETDPDARVLLIVPNVTLVNQMFGDFKDYSSHNGWSVDSNCQRLYSGLSKELSKRVLISTWQSFAKISKDKVNGPKILSLYRGVICDEAHLAKGIEMQSILEKCTHAEYRIGATGTIDTNQNAKLNVLQIEGFLGPLHRVITTKQLIDTKQVSGLNIKALVLKYSDEECKLIKSADYQQEVKWLVENKKRNAFLVKLSLSTDGTTLLLVNHRDTHAKVLVEELFKVSKRPVYYIAGDVNADERERIRQVANTENCIIVATFQTMSAGVNLPNIRHVIFGFPSKSSIRVLQSIGRGLRLHTDKTHMVLWDVIDDLRVKKAENYAYQHAIERLTIYRKEQFDIAIKELPTW